MKKVLFTATVDSHILHFHIPYLKLFKDKGYEVHVATNGDEEIPYCDVKHKISFERSPIKINNLKAIKELKKIINKEAFEIIHCHTPMGSVVTRFAAKKARKKGTRVIYTAHGFHFFKGASKLNWIIFYPIEKFLSRYTDAIITINKEDYDLAKSKFHCDIKYIPGVGISKEKFDFNLSEEELNQFRKELGITENDFVMSIIGELNANKNQMLAFNVMKELIDENKNLKLLIIGDGVLKEDYEKYIVENNLQDNVYLLGYRTDVAKLLKVTDLQLSLSHREGLPVNVMEGMITGVPVIVTNCRGNRDLVQEGKNGYIIGQDDKEKLKELIQKIINNKEEVEMFRQNSMNMAKEYLLENIIREYEEIYNV